ncbi:ATP-dependent RNA helicase HrpA [Corynebacterium amycolatum]|uniref:ATP-dependent RNA helicase HrpA n=1 Tax=Corynebacterium amycolatum TaxID=43765 RepID=UPI00254DB104|nr:ATP-dependent RNA helicase HrpA [Corynebacterium amycolatum]MDK8819885.1 ATP-dependent RNA helicase HrpA [Corynebacterium amycolatum]
MTTPSRSDKPAPRVQSGNHHSRHRNSARPQRSDKPAKDTRKKELYQLADQLPIREAQSFRRRLKRASAPKALSAISADLDFALERLEDRRNAIPRITYPAQLPVSARRDDIAEAIENNQVVIIAGETGSGKTTQIPKICLELGRGVRGKIGHTQPRRIAARSVAERIAHELGEKIGQHVGYAVRFDDRVGKDTCIKLMTDGILLAEIGRDRLLREYDTIIIDEAHERSLNIDFLLGYLKHILPQRPDLKIIITSATIDPERFARHFAPDDEHTAPIIEVSGRTYPVEIRYRPLVRTVVAKNGQEKEVAIEQIDGVIAACEELMRLGDGDILVFFSGEREIREAAEAIEGRRWKGVEAVPLFGRLSNAEQHRIFTPHSGRRIVLATNIAETSLTVPGIEYVVDTGTARISRYSTRTKVQRLPVEDISQASANQRSGRCGRVADGVAIRLYSEEEFLSRPEFTDPEILRTNLASVVLQMISLRLGAIEAFPFVQPPEHKAVRDGINLLTELQAITTTSASGRGRESDSGASADAPELTDIGRQIARIPVDPRLARMLVEGYENTTLGAVTVIVAALSLQDVRERPLEFQAQADQLHARFKDTTSDFNSLLKLWEYLEEKRRELSGNQFRKMCKREYLHYLRVREWQDLVRQLHQATAELGWSLSARSLASGVDDPDEVAKSLLPGLLSMIGTREGEGKEFTGTRNTKFLIHPSSALAKKPPRWVMAAEIVETSRTFARNVGTIQPQWVEKVAPHLLKHQYSEPHWSAKRGAAMAYQKSTLYGVPVVVDRLVPYHRVDADAARSIFIRCALVDGEWNTHHEFFKNNQDKLAEAAKIEEKQRSRGIVVDDDVLYAFYDSKLPASITTAANFDRWWKKTKPKQPNLLDFDPNKLLNPDAGDIDDNAFPEMWQQGSVDFSLSYKFEPGAPDDGVTLRVPVPLLAGLREDGFDWQVPGLRAELAEAYIRTLPKALRKSVVPAPDFARRALETMTPYSGRFVDVFADALRRLGGSGINGADFDPSKLPAHLRFNYAVIDRHGNIVDQSRDLAPLRAKHAATVSTAVSKRAKSAAHEAVKKWTSDNLGTVAETVKSTVDGQSVTMYPTLVTTKDGVAVEVKPTKAQAEATLATTNLTMLLRECPVNAAQMTKGLPLQQRVGVDAWPHGGGDGLVEDCRVAVIRDCMIAAGGPVRSPEEFNKLLEQVRSGVASEVRQLVVGIAQAMPAYVSVTNQLDKWEGDAIDDMRRQLEFMFPKGAVAKHGWQHLRHLPRYLQAMEIRLEEMNRDPGRDADREDEVTEAREYLAAKLERLPKGRAHSAEVRDIQWLIEELRVSLFAQRLGTAHSVSLTRIKKRVDKLR